MIQPDDVILFQGDSITDAGRSRANTQANFPDALGRGYAFHAAATLRRRRPADDLTIYNRGISGNQITDLADRWQADCLDLKPTVLSILIGVNDTWRGFDSAPEHAVPMDVYERTYRQLLTGARAMNPDLRLVLCEPFVLTCGVVTEAWLPEIAERRAVVAKLCDEFNAKLVGFQAAFDAAAERAPCTYWAGDGVHPSMAGHQLMAETWLEAVGEE